MAFNGLWKRTGNENALAVLKHIGMSEDAIKGFSSVEASLNIKQDGDNFDEVSKTGPTENRTLTTLGKECELKQWNGVMVKCVPIGTGDKRIDTAFDFNGVHYKATREIVGNQLIDTIDLDNGKVVGKFIYTKS